MKRILCRNGRRVIGTRSCSSSLQSKAKDQVDVRAFLNVRLMDLYLVRLGSAPRSVALDELRGKKSALCSRFHVDRDSALSKFDGLLLGLPRNREPQWVEFDCQVPVDHGAHLVWPRARSPLPDRSRVGDLNSTTRALQDGLRIPCTMAVWPAASGNARAGRGGTSAHSQGATRGPGQGCGDFYRLLAREDVWMTDQGERVLAVREGGALDLAIITGGAAEACYRRRFVSDETREVRLYLQGGDDRVV